MNKSVTSFFLFKMLRQWTNCFPQTLITWPNRGDIATEPGFLVLFPKCESSIDISLPASLPPSLPLCLPPVTSVLQTCKGKLPFWVLLGIFLSWYASPKQKVGPVVLQTISCRTNKPLFVYFDWFVLLSLLQVALRTHVYLWVAWSFFLDIYCPDSMQRARQSTEQYCGNF